MDIGIDITAFSLDPSTGLSYTIKLEMLSDRGAEYISGIRELMRAYIRKDDAAFASLSARWGLAKRTDIAPESRGLIARLAQYTDVHGDDNLFGFTSVYRGSIDDRLFFSGESAHDFMRFLAEYPHVDTMKQSPMLIFADGGDVSFIVTEDADGFTVAPVLRADGVTYPCAELYWYDRHIFAGRTVYAPACDVRSLAALFGISDRSPRAVPIRVTRDSFTSFMRTAYPVLTRTAPLSLPASFGGELPPAQPMLYLDDDGGIRGHLSFCYGTEACAVPGIGDRFVTKLHHSDIPREHRDANAEMKALETFRSQFGDATLFGADGMEETAAAYGLSFTITDDATALRFVREICPALTAHGFHTAVSKSFERFSSIRELALTAAVEDDGGWFIVRFSVDGISAEDVRAVMKAMRAGKTSVRLSDGTLAGIPPEKNGLFPLIDSLAAVNADGSARVGRTQIAALAACTGIDLGDAKEFAASLASLPPPRTLGNDLDHVLRHYQKDGIAFLVHRYSLGISAILADDMGLGKTLMALGFLTFLHAEKKGTSLVICPSSLLFNWENEAKRFAPGLSVAVLAGSPSERAERIAAGADILVTSYAAMVNDIALHREKHYRSLVLDEAQQIKNYESRRSRLVRDIAADVRLALTGTPIENRIAELWAIGDFLMPGMFGERASFEKRYGSLLPGSGSFDVLRAQLKTFVLRRTKAEVAPELPPRIESTLVCDLSEEQKKLYLAVRDQAVSEVKKVFAGNAPSRSYISIFAALTKLKQVVCHPALVASFAAPLVASPEALTGEASSNAESAKTELFLELADELRESGRRALVFSQYTSMLDILSCVLDERGYAHVRLDGGTKDRGKVVAEFQREDGPPFFLISLKAGGTGLTLTAADTVILYDLWWNPAVERQAADRAHRIGQTKTVNIYRLIARGTIEERILALQEKKAALAESLIDETSFSQGALSEEDIASLLAVDDLRGFTKPVI